MTASLPPMAARPQRGRRATTTLIVVGVVVATLIAGAYFLVTRFEKAMNGPLNPVARMDALRDLPKYPLASFDEMATRSQLPMESLLESQFHAKKTDSIGLSAVINPAQIIQWYDREMPNAGYLPDASTDLSKFFREAQTRLYRKGDQVVLIQVQGRTQMDRDTLVLVYRFSGVE